MLRYFFGWDEDHGKSWDNIFICSDAVPWAKEDWCINWANLLMENAILRWVNDKYWWELITNYRYLITSTWSVPSERLSTVLVLLGTWTSLNRSFYIVQQCSYVLTLVEKQSLQIRNHFHGKKKCRRLKSLMVNCHLLLNDHIDQADAATFDEKFMHIDQKIH